MNDKTPPFKSLSTTRRRFLGQFLGVTAATLGAAAGMTTISPGSASAARFFTKENKMTKLILPELPYSKEALAPVMSAETLEYHHDKHHKAYADKGTELIEKAGLGGKSVEEIIISSYGKADQAPLFNNVAQFWNHNHFWNWMKANGGGEKLPGALEAPVTKGFGGFAQFRDKFIADGMAQFGSGWVWLVSDDAGALSILKTPNGENPLVHGKTAILGCDVWEHSYYIDYRNARQKYLEAFVDKLVNWDYVAELYSKVS